MLRQFQSKRGLLILIGGAEDKKDQKTVLKKVLEVTAAKNIIIIPTASSYPREVANGYLDAFKNLGLENIDTLDIRYEDEADSEDNFRKLENADLIYFGGGDQVKLVNTFINTILLQKIKNRFLDGNLHIVGTSAGAASASKIMTYDGDNMGFNKGSVNFSQGFGFIEDVTIDTHFLARERIPRLVQFLITGKSTKGIGIDEDTGIIIYPDDQFEVIGSGMVTIINSDKATGSNYEALQDKEVFSVNNIRIGFLAPGTMYSLKKWSIIKSNVEKKKLEDFFEDVICQ